MLTNITYTGNHAKVSVNFMKYATIMPNNRMKLSPMMPTILNKKSAWVFLGTSVPNGSNAAQTTLVNGKHFNCRNTKIYGTCFP